MSNKNTNSNISPAARILALILSVLVAGSALTGVIYLLINLFS
jgi:hypothetical protein